MPTQIYLGQWSPFAYAIMNKRQVAHILHFCCKSVADIEINSIVTSCDLSAFYSMHNIM